MVAELYDFVSRKKVDTFGAEVMCIGGQQNLFFEISVTGRKSGHIVDLVNKDFRNAKVIDQHLLGMNASVVDDAKLRIALTFPVGANLNDPAKAAHLAKMIADRLTDLARQI